MADFIDVVKGLKDNKKAADDGFSRLEAAIRDDDAPSIIAENEKKAAINTKKEQTYFKIIGDEVSELNKNFLGMTGAMKSPAGILGGIAGLLLSPVLIIGGFLQGLGEQFKALGKLVLKGKLFKNIGDFFRIQLPDLFKKGFKGFKGNLFIKPFFDMFDDMSKILKPIFQNLRNTFFRNTVFDAALKNIKGIMSGIVNFFPNLIKSIRYEFLFGGDKAKAITKGIQFMLQPVVIIRDLIKQINTGPIKKGIDAAVKAFGFVKKFSFAFGRLLSRFFPPIFIVITAFETISQGIDDFMSSDGNMVQSLIAGFFGLVKGLVNSVVAAPLDLLKDIISYVLNFLGFDKASAALDSFSFVKIYSDFSDSIVGLINGGIDWIVENLHPTVIMKKVGEMLSAGLNIANEFGKTIQRLVHGGINFVKSLFGFGDKSDFGTKEFPVVKDIKAFLEFDWFFDSISSIIDFVKNLFDFDVLGYLKSFPGVSGLISLFSSEESSTNQDAGMKSQQERTKRMKELEKGLKEGSYDGFLRDSKDETAELKRLKEEEKAYFAKIRAGSADKGNQKNLTIADITGTGGSRFRGFKARGDGTTDEERLKQLMNMRKQSATGYNRVSLGYNDPINQEIRQLQRKALDESGTKRISQNALDRMVVGGGGTTTVVNNTNNSPVNNNSSTTTLSPLTQVDPVMQAAIHSGP